MSGYSAGFRDAWGQAAHSVRDLTAENARLSARVHQLTAALTELAHDPDHGPHAEYDEHPCQTCIARAVLAGGQS